MKKLVLLGVSMFSIICFVNAQNNQNNDAQHYRKPMKDSSFQKKHFEMQDNSFAQEKFNKGFKQQRKMGILKGLHLTPDQLKQAKTINDDFHKQLASLQGNDKISLGDYKSKLAAIHKDRKTKLLAVLNDKQKEQIAQHKKNAEINAQVKNAARLERLKLTLGLSEEQLSKIKTKQTELHSKIKAIHENDALLPEQKKEELKSLMAQRKDFIKTILTPEQQTKADSLRKNFRGNFKSRWNVTEHPPVSK